MPRGNPKGYITTNPVKPAPQGFQGEAAGGTGTYGTTTDANTLAYSASGSMGKAVNGGDASAYAKAQIHRSTGMQVEGSTPASAFPKP